MNKNILISGEKYLDIDKNNKNSHYIACKLMLISFEISEKENSQDVNNINEQKEELIKSLEDCYPYLEFLFSKMDDEKILNDTLDLIYSLINSKKDFKESKSIQLISKIYDFMVEKSNQRSLCLKCMKLLDIILEYEQSSNQNQIDKDKYIDCIVNIMAFKDITYYNIDKLKNVEGEINILGNKILDKLLDENYFNKLLKDFSESANNFEPNKNDKDLIKLLEISIKKLVCIIEIKNYYELGIDIILTSLKSLLEKEVKYIEFFKIEKSKEKTNDFYTILKNFSSRMLLELNLNIKINELSKQKGNIELYVKTLDIILTYLSKSTDKINKENLLNYFKLNYEYIIDSEKNKLFPDNINLIEKIIIINLSIFKKMIEEDDIISSILNNLIYLSKKNISYCNNMVKEGCIKLLLQVIESSLNDINVELSLELLKIILNSNEENIKIISTQNVLNIISQTKKKYELNKNIINLCDDISKEILKSSGKENYVVDLITENINQFNINSKNDFSDVEMYEKNKENINNIVNYDESNEEKEESKNELESNQEQKNSKEINEKNENIEIKF